MYEWEVVKDRREQTRSNSSKSTNLHTHLYKFLSGL